MNALIYIHAGIAAHKQAQLCLDYAMARGWQVSLVPAGAWGQAVRLIREGRARVLVMAYRDERADEIVRAVEEAGGYVAFCRPGRSREAPPAGHDTDEIVLRMASRGGNTDEIVRLLGVAEDRVRSILDRVRRRRSR